MVYKFFHKNFASLAEESAKGSGFKSAIKNDIKQNEKLADELHKPIIRNFEKRKIHSSFKDNIWDDDLADMQLINKFSKRIHFLLCVIDIFSKYA